MTVGEKIRHHRKLLRLTQTELGERLGVKKNAVSKWECGRVDDIPSSKIKAMARLFSVRPSYLIDEDSSPVPPLSSQITAVINAMDQMNIEGQNKVAGYATDLVASGNYKKQPAISPEEKTG